MATLPNLNKGVTKDPTPPATDTVISPITIPNGTILVTTKTTNETIDNVDQIIDYISGDNSPNFISQLAIENLVSDLAGKEPSLGFTPENIINKGAISGYAALDASQELLLANFPSGAGLQVLRRNTGNTALEFATVSIVAITSINSDTTTAQVIAGTTNRISLVDAGATHTFDIDSGYVGQSSITTLGTITTGVWNGTAIAGTNINAASTDLTDSVNIARTSDDLSFFAATTSLQLLGVISDETGSGLLVFGTSPTIVTPTIASFTNATHNHEAAAGGGQLNALNALDATGTQDSTTFLRGDNTWAIPAGGGGSLDALSDVTITSRAANQVLVVNAGNTLWVNTLIDNLNLASGVFGNITGLGTLIQDILMGGNNITGLGLIQSDNTSLTTGIINLDADEKIVWDSINDPEIFADTFGGMRIKATGGLHFVNPGIVANFTLESDRGSPATGNIISNIFFVDNDDGATRRTYSQITSKIFDPAASSLDGELFLSVTTGNILQDYIIFNLAGSGNIDINRNMDFGGNLIQNIGAIRQENVTNFAGFINIENSARLFWENNAGTDQFGLEVNGSDQLALASTSGFLLLNENWITGQTAHSGTADVTNDRLLIFDNSNGDIRQIAPEDLGLGGGGTGDVVGPASATDNAIARFDTTTGKLIQNGVITIDNSANMQLIRSAQFANFNTQPGAALTWIQLNNARFELNTTVGNSVVASVNGSPVASLGENLINFHSNNIRVSSAYIELNEIGDPTAPGFNIGRLYIKNVGGVSHLFIRDDVGAVDIQAGGTGDVVGPAGSTNEAVALFDGTTGILIQNSNLIYDTSTSQLQVPGAVVLTAAGTVPAGTNTYLREDGSDLDINVADGGSIFLQFGSAQRFLFTSTQLNMSGGTLTNATFNGILSGATIEAVGGITYDFGIKQSFNPSNSNAGINVGENAADPNTPVNGDIYYQTSVGLRARIEGAWVSLGAGGGTGDVVGPASSGDNVIVTFDSTTGKLIQEAGSSGFEPTIDVAGQPTWVRYNIFTTNAVAGPGASVGWIGNQSSEMTINGSIAAKLQVQQTTILRASSTAVLLTDGINLILGTVTGTKIGTTNLQKIGFWNATPIIQPIDGATLTNNVTVGGTDNIIVDFVGSNYNTDASTIRDDIYQLARKVKIITDNLRLIGLES